MLGWELFVERQDTVQSESKTSLPQHRAACSRASDPKTKSAI